MPTPEELRKRSDKRNKYQQKYRAARKIGPDEAKRRRDNDLASRRKKRAAKKAKETPEETRVRKEGTSRKARERRAAKDVLDPDKAKKRRDREYTSQRDKREKMAEETPEEMEAKRKETYRKAKELIASERTRARKDKINRKAQKRAWRKKAALQRSDAKGAKEQAAVSERNNSFTSPTSDNRSVGPESPKDPEYYSTSSPDHNAAFTMTGMRTSLPHSNPGQTAHSRFDFMPTSDSYHPSSMNNIGYSAPPNTHTHIQTANSRPDPPPTIYYDSGPHTNSNNSLSLAGGYGPARPEIPVGYESAGFATSFAQPTSGDYHPSSRTSYESPIPSSITAPTADSMYHY
ncbi:uncharacterized protein EAE97_007978 [Botrytis byssoidea]|uniref:Uncharacterized protein n=1 Tax=Botrytis byssoidea TaxID=139641 RepID=A0A9P5IBI8_9HELO|nr:uncharacterized protein EAE97_007978 [Botrytis byssoidea]KAF7936612.1 hypothetical protein EAE97_007978 [Botrytis byssoidea]